MTGPTPTIEPCKHGHTVPRNKDGACPECVRRNKREAEARRRAKAKTAAAAAPVIPTPTPRARAAAPAPAPAAVGPTFLAAARELLATQHAEPATAEKHAYFLSLLTPLHARPMSELTAGEIARVLVAIQENGGKQPRVEAAHRSKALVHLIAEYAQIHGYTLANIFPRGMRAAAIGLRPLTSEPHAAVIDPEQLGRLVSAIDTYSQFWRPRAQPSVGAAMKLAPLVFVRPGELRSMEWSEINFDKAEWTIPGPKMKMKEPHVVPLSTQALAILREQQKITGTDRYVFRTKRADEPLSENGFREALETVLQGARLPSGSHTMHGWRATGRTRLSKLGYDREVIEIQLAHAERNKVVAAYERERFLNHLPERRAMMQGWANYLDDLKAQATKAAAEAAAQWAEQNRATVPTAG